MASKKVVMYTDGACSGNPGNGGWGAYIEIDDKKIELSGSENNTTNNRMELKAVIEALKEIEVNSQISLFSDSKYVIDGITKWIKNWKINDWKTTNKKEIKNLDLWMDLDKLTSKFKITWNWVKAHSTDEYNNKVDRLARNEAEKIS